MLDASHLGPSVLTLALRWKVVLRILDEARTRGE
jgi:hypothetical protein